MQASDRVLAWRYAKALFLAVVEKGEDAGIQGDLALAHRVLLSALPMLRHPQVTAMEKKKVLTELLGGKVAASTLAFLALLIDKKRFDLLPLITGNTVKLLAERNRTAKAYVRTARPLPPEAQQKLRDKLKDFAGKDIELEIKEAPELIGGVVVRLGDWVLDSSLRGQLKNMREKFNGN